MRKHVLGLEVLAIVLAGGLTATGMTDAQELAADSAGNAIAGQRIYFEHACYSCHGYTGETGVRALVGSGFLFNEALFTNFLRLRADQNPTLPSTQMPNYPEESLSDAEVGDLYAYIKTFRGNTPALKDVPTLQTIIESASRNYKQ